jgi:quinol monooxygenase YgiN
MKQLIVSTALLLNGCALYDAYTMTHYDPNEYRIITEIRADAQQYKAHCNDPVASKINATVLAEKTHMFSLYSEHVPKNKDVIAASVELDAIAQGLANQYAKTTVSAGFCGIKFGSIETSADYMQKIIGARPR